MDGYETEERTIQFSDNLLKHVLSLESVLEQGERSSEYRAIEEEDRGRSECN